MTNGDPFSRRWSTRSPIRMKRTPARAHLFQHSWNPPGRQSLESGRRAFAARLLKAWRTAFLAPIKSPKSLQPAAKSASTTPDRWRRSGPSPTVPRPLWPRPESAPNAPLAPYAPPSAAKHMGFVRAARRTARLKNRAGNDKMPLLRIQRRGVSGDEKRDSSEIRGLQGHVRLR